MPSPHRLDLPGTLRAPGQARRFAAEVLGDHVGADRLSDVLIVVSELVTNAVLHAGTPCTVELREDGDVLQVRVFDGGGALPVRRLVPTGVLASGRGLHLLDRLALRWGTEQVAPLGKVVWAELARD